MGFDFSLQPGKQVWERKLALRGEPLLSVITPVYNRSQYFEQTLQCVLNQTFPWFEWIIIDDGSSDPACLEMLDGLPERDNRIRVLHQENRGLAGARNTGFRNAKADIVIPLDDDDLISPTYLEELWWALKQNPGASWAYTDGCGFQDQEYVWIKPFSSERMKEENLLVATAAIRKSAYEDIGGYEELKGYYHEDWAFWLKLLAKGHYPVHVAGIHFWYRRHGDSMLSHTQAREAYFAKLKAAVTQTVQPVEYPCERKQVYSEPIRSSFDRHVYADHNKCRVMMILPWMNMGGADRFNLDLLRMLDKQRYEVTIVTTLASENTWRQEFEKYAHEVYALREFMDTNSYPEFLTYLIDSRDIDLLLVSNSYHGFSLLPWLKAQYPALPIVVYIHMEEWYWRNGGFSRAAAAYSDIVEKICTCNEQSRQVLVDHFHCTEEKTETVYIGVDSDVYNPETVAFGEARKELGIGQTPMVLFPCRMNAQKRPWLMLDIAERMKNDHVVFAAVGNGAEYDSMCAAIRERGLEQKIRMVGERKDLRPWYRDADVTLICSIKEGLALTAYESCSMATPVVTSDVGGQAELVNNQIGVVLPLLQDEERDLHNTHYSEEEIEQYVHALRSLLQDENMRKEKGRLARQRILDGFSLYKMVEHMEAVFDEATKAVKEKVPQYLSLQPVARALGESYLYYNEMETISDYVAWRDQQIAVQGAVAEPPKNQLDDIAFARWNKLQHFLHDTFAGKCLRKILHGVIKIRATIRKIISA